MIPLSALEPEMNETLLDNPLVLKEPWSNYGDNFTSGDLEPIPIPIPCLVDPPICSSVTQSASKVSKDLEVSPSSSELGSARSEATKAIIDDVSHANAQAQPLTFPPLTRTPPPHPLPIRPRSD